MNISSISRLFKIVAAKHLSAVDSDPTRSHGHEIGGLSALHSELQGARTIDVVRYIYVGEEEIVAVDGGVTWYDSRANVPHRGPEWRMYYKDNEVTDAMTEGDFLLVGLMQDLSMLFLVVGKAAGKEESIKHLFGIEEIQTKGFTVIETKNRTAEIGLFERNILDFIGIEYEYSDDTFLDEILRRFNGEFPETAVFSAFARETLQSDLNKTDPDALLIQYLNREELLFKTLEKYQVEERLKKGFSNVEEFVSYSLSIQNRRKSRAGHALENHLDTIFKDFKLKFDKGAKTEGNSKPDFLFPGKDSYVDSTFSPSKLVMLGVKTTCKDRWRQILAEAARIPVKHLLTLEAPISKDQTSEMIRHKVQLVVPSSLHAAYSEDQRKWVWNFGTFLEYIKSSQ